MKITKTHLVVSAGLMMSTPVYAGSEIETLFNMLLENGTVSEAQYGRLMAELNQNKAEAKKSQAELDTKLAEAVKPSDVDISVKGGLKVKTKDGAFETKLGGRVQADAAAYGGEPELGDGTEIRRARLYLSGKMYNDWAYKFQYEFVNSGAKGIKDAYLAYNGFDNLTLKVGNFKDPFSLEEQTSSKYVSFMERSLITAFSAGRHIGFMGSTSHKDWTLAAGVFGDTVDTKGGENDEDWGLGTRATWAPIHQKSQVLHFGLGMNYRDTRSAGTAKFKTQPETHIAGESIVNTGTISDVTDYFKLGAELAYVKGPFSTQAEYIATDVNREDATDLDFDGWYAQAGYFFTGESRNYKSGKFGSLKPKANVGEGGIGAWELAIRYSSIDLTDEDIEGGEADSLTLGLNWFATPTLRFSANYVDVLDVKGGEHDDEEPSVFQVRSQWAF